LETTAMKSVFKSIIKQFTAVLLIHVISTTNHIQAMETRQNPNNCVTVVNENNDSSSLLQLNHKKAEWSIYSKNVINIVGMNHHLYLPETIKCLTARYKNNKSFLQLYDRHSKEENIDLIAYDGDKFIIHAKADNKIIVTKDGQQMGELTYE
jgi:hypothetical protein